jgi:hypothetical protein
MFTYEPGRVTHAYNPSHSGDRDLQDCGSELALESSETHVNQ